MGDGGWLHVHSAAINDSIALGEVQIYERQEE
jgi:hypothetical protein